MKVKDLRIEACGKVYQATAEFYTDRPDRDRDSAQSKVFDTIPGAQRWLSQFGRDCYEGAWGIRSVMTFKTPIKQGRKYNYRDRG